MFTSRIYGWSKFGMSSIVGLVLLLTAVPSPAQLPTGSILGVVRDTSGGVVASATVTVRNLDTGLSRTLTTESDGSYRFPALPVGHYEVDVTHEGFNTETRAGLTLTVTQEAVVNVTLRVGAATQRVVVTEQVPLVDTTSSSLGGLVSEQKIQELPLNGRNFLDLTMLQTGVSNVSSQEVLQSGSLAGIGGDVFTSNGAPTRSNNYMLDGAVMQNLFGMTRLRSLKPIWAWMGSRSTKRSRTCSAPNTA